MRLMSFLYRYCYVLMLVLMLSVVVMADDAPVEPQHTLHFGVFSYLGQQQTQQKYAPLVAYLNTVLSDEQIELHVLSQDELNQRIQNGDIDLVTTNPTHFLVARAHYPLTGVIATLVESHEGRPVYQLGGTILTLAHRTDINRLQDLRGKVVAIPSQDNMGGYRAQVYELYRAGVRVPEELSGLLETGTHRAAVAALLEGRADVAFVRDGILEQMQREGALSGQSLKVLNAQFQPEFAHKISTRLYPEWPVFALPHVDDRTIRHVAAALFSLDPEHPAARQAGIYGFTVPADYLPVEELSRTLRLPPYDHLPEFTFQDAWERWQHLLLLAGATILLIVLLSAALVWHWGKAHIERSRFRTLLQGLGEGVYGVDIQGRCTFINEAAMRMLRVSASQVLGKDQHQLFHHHYQDGRIYPYDRCPVTKTLSDGRQRQLREWFIRQDGNGFPVDLTVTPLFSRDDISGAVVAFSDVTQRVKVEQENKRLTEYNRMLLESAGDGIYGCDMQGRCTFINPAALKMLGLCYEDVIGRDQHMIFHYRRPSGAVYPHEECPVYRTLHEGTEQQCEDYFVHSSGDLFPVHLKVSPIFEAEEQVGVVVVFQDITEQKAIQTQLITLTTTDELTGLYNRRYFQKQLRKEFSRYQRSFADTAVLMIDLDHFKQINDTFGHAAGDKVLQEFARLLTQSLRSSDLSARVGGEEFAVLLPNTDIRQAEIFANRLRNQVAGFKFHFEQQEISVTISAGCTLMTLDDSRPDMALARADKALYEAKSSGRNRVVTYA